MAISAQTKFYLPYTGMYRIGARGSRTIAGRGSSPLEVTVHWFVCDRREPIAPYEILILNHRGLSPAARESAQHIVDEFFSEAEFHQLRDYLRGRQPYSDIRTEILMAPVSAIRPDNTTRVGTSRPFGRRATITELGLEASSDDVPDEEEGEAIVASGLIRLIDEPGYTLPFGVCGYYALPERGRGMTRLASVTPETPKAESTAPALS